MCWNVFVQHGKTLSLNRMTDLSWWLSVWGEGEIVEPFLHPDWWLWMTVDWDIHFGVAVKVQSWKRNKLAHFLCVHHLSSLLVSYSNVNLKQRLSAGVTELRSGAQCPLLMQVLYILLPSFWPEDLWQFSSKIAFLVPKNYKKGE